METQAKYEVKEEALKPDKDKLYEWANELMDTEGPELKSEEARKIRQWAISQVGKTAKTIIKQAKEL